MNSGFAIEPAFDDRWLIPTPGPDETLRSVLYRAADIYRISAQRLWETIQETASRPLANVDNPSDREMDRLTIALGVRRHRLERLRQLDGSLRLAPDARSAYCPSCWREDDQAGRPRHFRRAWAGVLAVRCARHRIPLFPWHPTRGYCAPGSQDDLTIAELVWQGAVGTPASIAFVHAIGDFADSLTASLATGAAWPDGWLGDAEHSRTLLAHVMAIDHLGNAPLIASVQAPLALQALIHSGRPKADPGTTDGWKRLRNTADPGIRRMALWLVGARVVPTWPNDFRPTLHMPRIV